MGFPTGKNRRGLGPHHFGKFGLRLEVNVGDGGAVAKVEVEEGVVKLNGAERWCDPVAQGSNACAFNGKRTSLGERKPLGFVVNDGLSVIGVEKDCTVPAGCKTEFLTHLRMMQAMEAASGPAKAGKASTAAWSTRETPPPGNAQ